MLKKINIHQKIAIFYFLISLPVIGILFGEEFNPAIRDRMIAFVCGLAVTIIVVPIFLRFELIKRNFNWMDALTTTQKEVILNLKIKKYHKIQCTSADLSRIKPYIIRIGVCSLILSLVGSTPIMINTNLSILCGALSIYLFGVLLAITATVLMFSPNK
jgi:hypothetical protein